MKSNKKGFTIVELVIVIAIIAILAAVLIPTFASLVKKANVSADTQLVRNLNMAVEIEKASSNAKHETMHDALMTAQDAGYDVDTIVAKSGYNIAWDSANDRFVLVDKAAKKYIYPTSENTDENSISNPADYFLFCKDATKIGDDTLGYSYYLSRGATLPAENKLTVKSGLDVGDVNVAEITVTGNAVVRTNGGTLIVNAENGHVEHYGLANEADIQNVSDSTYVEHGIVGKMTVASGKKVVLKATAVVGSLSGDATKENGAFVTGEDSTITVSTYAQLQGLALASTAGIDYKDKTIKLANDIDLTGKKWVPFGFDNKNEEHKFSGTIDGDGHKIIGLSTRVGYGFVQNKTAGTVGCAFGFIAHAKGNVKVTNITFEGVDIDVSDGNGVGAVLGCMNEGNLTVDKVKVYGNIKAQDKVGGLFGIVGYQNANEIAIDVKDCDNYADVTAERKDKYNRAGGFFGQICPNENKGTFKLNNLNNYGNISATGNNDDQKTLVVYAGAIIGHKGNELKVTFTNCKNHGTIKATTTNTASPCVVVTGAKTYNTSTSDNTTNPQHFKEQSHTLLPDGSASS